jgi:sugar transferase (PEP-CTERM/EpsH1 system associated)
LPPKAKIRGALSLLRGRSFSVGYFYQKTLQKIIDEWTTAHSYDAIIYFSSPMAEYLFRSSILKKYYSRDRAPCTVHPAPCFLMDFVDVDSDKWRQYAENATFPSGLIYRIESKFLFKYEQKINRYFDYSVFVSQPEADLFSKRYPDANNVKVVSNGVDHNYFSPDYVNSLAATVHRAPRTSNPIILFTGAMDYHANIDGVTWFCSEIFPLVRRENPSVEFHIVGSNPASDVKKLAQKPGVKVTGFVEDIRPYYRMADVCVVPLRLARGIQNKVLEAMSMAKPIVTTSKALEGIGAISGEQVLVADNAESFAGAVGDLLKNKGKKKSLAVNARQFVVNHFDWSANIQLLEDLLQKK